MARLAAAGIHTDADRVAGAGSAHRPTITDPDGRTIELVEWPPGHPAGMTTADWPDDDEDEDPR